MKSEDLDAGRVTLDAGRITPQRDHIRDAHQCFEKHRNAGRIITDAGRVTLIRKQNRIGNRSPMKERSAIIVIRRDFLLGGTHSALLRAIEQILGFGSGG